MWDEGMPSRICHLSKCTVVVLSQLQPWRMMLVQDRAISHQQSLRSAPSSKCIKEYQDGLFTTTGVS